MKRIYSYEFVLCVEREWLANTKITWSLLGQEFNNTWSKITLSDNYWIVEVLCAYTSILSLSNDSLAACNVQSPSKNSAYATSFEFQPQHLFSDDHCLNCGRNVASIFFCIIPLLYYIVIMTEEI